MTIFLISWTLLTTSGQTFHAQCILIFLSGLFYRHWTNQPYSQSVNILSRKKKHYPFTTSTKQTSFKNWYRYAKLNLEAILIEMVVFQSLYWTTQPPSSLIIIRMKITGAHPHFISKDAIYRRLAGSRNRTACHNLVV